MSPLVGRESGGVDPYLHRGTACLVSHSLQLSCLFITLLMFLLWDTGSLTWDCPAVCSASGKGWELK